MLKSPIREIGCPFLSIFYYLPALPATTGSHTWSPTLGLDSTRVPGPLCHSLSPQKAHQSRLAPVVPVIDPALSSVPTRCWQPGISPRPGLCRLGPGTAVTGRTGKGRPAKERGLQPQEWPLQMDTQLPVGRQGGTAGFRDRGQQTRVGESLSPWTPGAMGQS